MTDPRTVYLDHAATTPMLPVAVEAMTTQLAEVGNASSLHASGRRARRVVEESRETIARALNSRPGDVVFTSGGTEADNLALKGILWARRAADPRRVRFLSSAVEHHAVLDPVIALGGRTVAVDAVGRVYPEALAAALDDDVTLVSVMLANNEVGTIQPLAEVVDRVRQKAPEALVHTDAVQGFPWLDVATAAAGADLLALSAHKFGGPKGVGVLVVRSDAALEPQILGGGQERERRSGTHNVAGVVAMATAARITADQRAETVARVERLRDRLADGLRAAIPGLVETGVGADRDRSHKVAGACHVCIPDVESEELLFLLGKEDVFASAASSCASGAMDPSHVLAAMGIDRDLAKGSLRLSLGFESTDADVDAALAAIPPAVDRLRAPR